MIHNAFLTSLATSLRLPAFKDVWGPMIERYRDRRAIARIDAMDPDMLAELHTEITLAGDLAPTSFHLFPTGDVAETSETIVTLPQGMRVENLSGKVLRVKTDPSDRAQVRVELCDTSAQVSQIGGKHFDLVGIPRVATSSGRVTNRRLPEQWLRRNPQLLDLVWDIHPHNPARVFEVLLKHGTINAGFDWMQEPVHHNCPACNTRRKPVMQLWGKALGLGAAAQVYVMACGCAIDQFSTVIQSV